MILGKIYKNNAGDEFVVLDKKCCKSVHRMKVLVKFLATGSTRWVYESNANKGKVKDFYKRTRYGIGYLGEINSKKKLPYYQQAKQLWANVLKRCYCEKDTKGYHKWGTEVCPRWHCLANFIEDLPRLENFDKWLSQKRTGVNYNLDKDFRVPGCNVYSPDTCMFIDEHTNKSEGAKTTVEGYYRKVGSRPVAKVC